MESVVKVHDHIAGPPPAANEARAQQLAAPAELRAQASLLAALAASGERLVAAPTLTAWLDQLAQETAHYVPGAVSTVYLAAAPPPVPAAAEEARIVVPLAQREAA